MTTPKRISIRVRLATVFAAVAGMFAAAVLLPGAQAHAESTPFNQLVLKKQHLERTHGIANLECFPFLEQIGGGAQEVQHIRNCLQGMTTLAAALEEVPDAGLKRVGISTRFLRTGGFHTLLVQWNADRAEMVQALRDRLSPEEQKRFMDRIVGVKSTIHDKLFIRELYCSLTIPNDQCLQGYRTLASVEPDPALRRKMWAEVVITDSAGNSENPEVLSLRFDATAAAMRDRLREDTTQTVWKLRKKTYETIQERFGDTFKKLQLPTFFCEVNLSAEECRQGAEHFAEAAESAILQSKTWGKVRVTRHNTRIRSDYDVTFRYDLSPEEIVEVFSVKPTKKEIEQQVTRAEKLEERTKNNSTGLRAVCDLVDLTSALCVEGFEMFIDFVRAHPEFRAARPWTDVMFVNGTLLSRLNFAMNSNSRTNYIYVDARSTYSEFEAHLMKFARNDAAPVR
ncbi:hypothetical protein [Nitrospina watsonii]|uniref:Uncharacterized protein n=1 Tax=Nitrospina watsonii TaxID=1323948 RepID=A0ABM9HB73_9BACT|nr:hypothetical protein [Nitrospina watsonii]CAI2717385.1 conserved exported protein of unknown function [Nitrospina watsonii]